MGKGREREKRRVEKRSLPPQSSPQIDAPGAYHRLSVKKIREKS